MLPGDSVWSVPLTDSSDVWVNAPLNDMIATSEGGCLVAGGGYGWNDGNHALVMKIIAINSEKIYYMVLR